MDYQILFQPPYDVFTIVALFTLGLSVVEILMFLFGFSFSKVFGHDHDVDVHFEKDFHFEKNFDSLYLDSIGSINLFNLGQVPFLLVLLSLSGFFSFFGFGIHMLMPEMFWTQQEFIKSNLFVVPLAVGLSSFCTYKVTKLWKKIFPNTESYAVSEKALIGKIGTVNLGTATSNNAVEISVYDEHQSKHYVMAEVALSGIQIEQNQKALIVHKNNNGNYLVLPFYEHSLEKSKNN